MLSYGGEKGEAGVYGCACLRDVSTVVEALWGSVGKPNPTQFVTGDAREFRSLESRGKNPAPPSRPHEAEYMSVHTCLEGDVGALSEQGGSEGRQAAECRMVQQRGVVYLLWAH